MIIVDRDSFLAWTEGILLDRDAPLRPFGGKGGKVAHRERSTTIVRSSRRGACPVYSLTAARIP